MSETIVPAASVGEIGWRLVLLPPAQQYFIYPSGRPYWYSVIAWAIGDDGIPAPITAMGRYDTTRPWLLQDPAGHFVAMPNGFLFERHEDAINWLKQGTRHDHT